MAFRRDRFRPLTAALPMGILTGALACALPGEGHAQVFVVGEKTAMADVSTDFHPTRVELPSTPITERGRRELVRYLEAEQGFAHRTLPLGDDIVLMANGNLTPGGDAYKELLYKKGESAQPGDRVVITTVTVKADRIVFDINGGPYLNHRFLRHIERCKLLLVVLDMAGVDGRKPHDDYKQLLKELELYNPEILDRPRVLVANKMDLPEAKKNLAAFKRKHRVRAIEISARAFPGKVRNRSLTSSSVEVTTAPARSRSLCSLRGLPWTVKSRSRIGNPLMISRTAPPVR